MSSCTPFINRTITEEVPCFREGNHQDWRGIQISVLVCHSVFSNDQHTASNATCSNLTFSRLIYHEGLAYVVMHALHKSNHHRGSSMLSRGKSPRLKGNPNFRPSLSFSFFQRSTYRLKCNVFKFDIFPAHLPYFGDYVHFLRINGHNSNSNNRCMKRCTRTVWKPCSCRLVNSHAFYKE